MKNTVLEAINSVREIIIGLLLFVVMIVFRIPRRIHKWWRDRHRLYDVSAAKPITDPADLMPYVFGHTKDQSAVAGYQLPLRERAKGQNTQAKLRELLLSKRYLLIVGPSGIGKTREATELIVSLMRVQQFRVLLVSASGWLGTPKQFPEELGNARRIVLFIDDLQLLLKVSPDNKPNERESNDAKPPSYDKRFQDWIRYYEEKCPPGEFFAIATARDDVKEWDELGLDDMSPWPKQDWKRKFREAKYHLPNPSLDAQKRVLADAIAAAELLPTEDEELEKIVENNDGTFSNLIENVRTAQLNQKQKRLTPLEFRENLPATYLKAFRADQERYPGVKFVYAAISMLSSTNVELHSWLVEALALFLCDVWIHPDTWYGDVAGRMSLNWNPVQQFRRYQHIRTAMGYILAKRISSKSEVLQPREGQLEIEEVNEIWKKRPSIWILKDCLLFFARRKGKGRLLYGSLVSFGDEHWDEAVLLTAVEAAPEQPLAHFRLGAVLARNARYEPAVEQFSKAIHLDDTDAAVYQQLGLAHDKLNQHEYAVKAFQREIDLEPSDTAYYRLARSMRKIQSNQSYNDAIKAYETIIQRDPSASMPYYHIGETLIELKRFDEAIIAFNKAIVLTPEIFLYHWGLANALLLYGKFPEAIAAYERAISLIPRNVGKKNRAELRIELGTALGQLNKYEEAVAAFREAIELDPSRPEVFVSLGYTLDDLGKYEEALGAYRSAVDLDSKNITGWRLLGFELERLHKFAEAQTAFAKIVELNDKDADAHNDLGRVLLTQDKLQEALAALDKAIELEPQNAQFQDMRRHILERSKLSGV